MKYVNRFLQKVVELFRSVRQHIEKALAIWLHKNYKYGPSLTPGSIRVLGLLPGKIRDPIRCTLQTRILDEAEDSYEAISYCWGLEPELATIFVTPVVYLSAAISLTRSVNFVTPSGSDTFGLTPFASIRKIFMSVVIKYNTCEKYTSRHRGCWSG